ncbi:MAG: hypothetical protein KGM47_18845 [Acidobacteriota bacterium]|nr:hypothetical protein [Acidobacteriota bacterium]
MNRHWLTGGLDFDHHVCERASRPDVSIAMRGKDIRKWGLLLSGAAFV